MPTTKQHTKQQTQKQKKIQGAVAVIKTRTIHGEITVKPCQSTKKRKARGVHLNAVFFSLPPGKHGFHIHKAGDLRGEGCKNLCEHYDRPTKGRLHRHGAGPSSTKERHTGDLGNIEMPSRRHTLRRKYCLPDVRVEDLWGRSIIVHADEDDEGRGSHSDSHTTGHSGKRMGCAIFGRC